jgi:hypothetical protein
MWRYLAAPKDGLRISPTVLFGWLIFSFFLVDQDAGAARTIHATRLLTLCASGVDFTISVC